MTNTTSPIEAVFGMQRQSLKHGERLFERSLDIQRNSVETFLENSFAVQRNAQRQSAELTKNLFDAQFEAFQLAFDDDEVRSTVLRQLKEFNASQSDSWDAFEDDFHAAVDGLSVQQREVAAQSVQAALSAQKEIEDQAIESAQQTQVAAQETAENAAEATDQRVEVTAESTEGRLEDIEGLGSTYADRLRKHGIESNAHLAQANAETIAQAADVSEDQAEQWSESAQSQA